MIGSQFVNVGGGVQNIQDFFAGGNTLAGLDGDYEFQSKLLSWTGTGYDTYGWYAEGDGTDPEVDWPEADAKWILFDQTDIADVNIKNGAGYWIQTMAAGEVTVSGEVPTGDSASVEVKSGLNLISNPFPVATNIQDVKPSAEVPGLDADYEFSTKLLRWTGTGYDTYGWYAEGDGTDPEVDWPEADAKWILFDQTDIADVTLNVGEGFWIQTTGSGSITFSK